MALRWHMPRKLRTLVAGDPLLFITFLSIDYYGSDLAEV